MQKLADIIQLQYYKNEKRVFSFFSPSSDKDSNYVCNEVKNILQQSFKIQYYDTEELLSVYENKDVKLVNFDESDDNEIVLVNAGGIFTGQMPLMYFKYFAAGILVIRAGHTRKALVKEAIDWLKQYDVELIGTVLCDVKRVIPNFIYRMVF